MVYDDVAPFLSMSNNVYKEINSDFDLCDSAFYGDNYDHNVAGVINGEYDKGKPGAYKLKMAVRDESKNTTEKNFTLNLID